MENKRTQLKEVWAKIESIRTRELQSKVVSAVSRFSGKIDSGLRKFDDFIEGNFDNKIDFLNKVYEDKAMIDYVKSLPLQAKKDNLSWLNAMENIDIFYKTLSVCPKLLETVYDKEKENGYVGLPVSFKKLMKIQNSIPAVKFVTNDVLLYSVLENQNTLNLDNVTEVIKQSPKNIDYLLKFADRFDNLDKVFEKHPSLIKTLDQNILLNEKVGKKIITSINNAAERNEKVKNFAEFYLSFFLDKDGKILEIKSKALKSLEELDNLNQRREKALKSIKNITSQKNENEISSSIKLRK